jgi:hypothetical protein
MHHLCFSFANTALPKRARASTHFNKLMVRAWAISGKTTQSMEQRMDTFRILFTDRMFQGPGTGRHREDPTLTREAFAVRKTGIAGPPGLIVSRSIVKKLEASELTKLERCFEARRCVFGNTCDLTICGDRIKLHCRFDRLNYVGGFRQFGHPPPR